MNKSKVPIIYALITIILWGTVAAVSKLLLNSISTFQLMFYIALFSTISLFIFILAKRKTKQILKLIKQKGIIILLIGILGLGFQQLFYVLALENAPTAQVNVLNYMWPIFILILSAFLLKEKFSPKILLSFALGLIGVYIVITQGQIFQFEIQYLKGYLFAIAAAFFWALFSTLSKKTNYEPITSMFLFNFAGLIFMTFLMIFTKSSFNIPFNGFLGTFYLGLLPTAIGFTLWIKALKKGKTSNIANLGHLTPFISLIFIALILKEKILFSEIIGLIVIVSGILLQIRRKRPE